MTEPAHASNPPLTASFETPDLQGIPQRLQNLSSQIASEARQRFGNNILIFWFGSWVKGTAQPHSDIDLAFDSPAISNIEFAAFRDWVDELPTLYSIDLVNLAEVGTPLRDEIKQTSVLL